MKVWIVSVGEPLPTDGKNVRLRRMGNLAQEIYQSGNKVEWFSVSFDHYKKIQRCNDNKEINVNENFNMHLVYTNGYKKNVSLSRIVHHKSAGKNIYKKMNELEKPDIIISSMEPLEVAEAATRYGVENNVPVVVDVRDLWPEIYYEVIPKSLHSLLDIYVKHCRSTLKHIMMNAYSIIGLSEGFLNYGLKFASRDRSEKDSVFPIAYPNYDYNKYKNKFDYYWNKYGIDKDDFIAIFLGNFGKQFDFEPIIEASNLLKDNENIKFVLCGTGVQLEDVKQNVSSNVILPGWIEKDQILSLVSNSDIGLAPYINSINYRENTPNKFGEYLSASLPILVSTTGVMEKLLEDKKCGYRYKNGVDLAEQIKMYYNDKIKHQEHSYNARKLYENDYNGDIAYKNMLNYLTKTKNIYNREEI